MKATPHHTTLACATRLQGFSLRALKHLVLDEADKLLDMDFEAEIDQILKVVPRDRRTQLFSATMTSKVQKLQRACLVSPVKVSWRLKPGVAIEEAGVARRGGVLCCLRCDGRAAVERAYPNANVCAAASASAAVCAIAGIIYLTIHLSICHPFIPFASRPGAFA